MAQRRLSLVLDLDTGQYSGRLAQAGSQMRSFGGSVDKSSASVRRFSDTFDRQGRAMSTPLQKLRDYVLIMGNLRLALLNVRDLAVGWVSSLVQQSAKVERLTVLMKGLSNETTELGKTQEAKRNMVELFDMARQTGFAVDDLTDSFVKFRSAKLDPNDGSLRALADAVAAFGGTSDVMHRASIAIQQMAGKGVISMEELRQQLGEAVPTAMETMARAMGKTVAELSKEVATGTVKAGPALTLMFQEMQRTYAGAGKRLSQTMTGQLAELRTNITALSTDFTRLGSQDGLFTGTTKAITELNTALKGREGREAMQALGDGVASIGSALVTATKFALEFRTQIGAGLKTVAVGLAALTAVRFASWIKAGMLDAVTSIRQVGINARNAGADLRAYRDVLSGNVNSQNAWAIQGNAYARQLQQIRGNIAAEQGFVSAIRSGITQRNNEIMNIDAQIAKINQLRVARQAEGAAAQAAAAQAVTAARIKVEAIESEIARTRTTNNKRSNWNVASDPQMVAARQAIQVATAEEVAALERVSAARAQADAAARNSALTKSQRANEIRTATRLEAIAEAELTQATNTLVGAQNRARTIEAQLVAQRNAGRQATAQEIALTNRLKVARQELAQATTRETTTRTINTAAANANGRAGFAILAMKQRQIALAATNAAATNAETAATARLTAAELMATVGKRAMAGATTLAAGATRLLGAAMQVALGPIGMAVTALYMVAQAAGVFESAADRAAAAAQRMADGFAAAGDAAVVAARKAALAADIKSIEDGGMIAVEHGDSFGNTGIRFNTDRDARLKAKRAELESLNNQEVKGARSAYANRTQQWQDYVVKGHENYVDRLTLSYNRALAAASKNIKDENALKARQAALRKEYDRRVEGDMANRQADLLRRINERKAKGLKAGPLETALSKLQQQAPNVIGGLGGVETAAAGAGKGLDKFGRAAANADAKVAGINAKLAGTGQKLAEFNSKLASGMFKGMSEDQIASLRRAAVATDALAASKKAAAADNSFEGKLMSMAGRLAQLQDSLTDGNGELAKFNAQLAASGDNMGLSPAQIQRLRDLAQAIDEGAHAKDVKATMDSLADALAKATTEGDELWASFARGTMDADQRLAQIKARFADKLIGLKGQELADAEARINKIVDAINRADQAETAQRWRDSAAEMRIALLDENAQREANFQRELQRQQQLLDAIRLNAALSADEKRKAEEGFLAWKAAAEARDQRASEGALASQARNWANLGQNIQQTMAQALGSVVDGMLDTNANFADLVMDILKQIMKVIMTAMIAYAILSAIGMTHNAAGQNVSMGQFMKGQMGGAFSPGYKTPASATIGYGAGGAPSPTVSVGTKHTGGVIGAASARAHVPADLFTKAKTYHGGGWIGGRQLKPGEVPMIGLDDEVVLTKEQQRLLGRSGGIGGGAPNVQVQVINNSGTELEAEHGEPEFNGKEMIVQVVVEAAQKQGKLRDVFQQMAKG